MINIFLRKITGKGQKLHINDKSSIRELISEVNRTFKYFQSNQLNNIHHIQLYHKGKRIDQDSQKLCEQHDIRNNSIIHIIQKLKQDDERKENQIINLKISIQNKLLTYQIQKQKTVSQLKQILSHDLQISQKFITLSHLGSQLNDKQSINQLKLIDNTLISAHTMKSINSLKFNEAQTLQKDDKSQGCQNIPKIQYKQASSPLRRIKKAQSLNVKSSQLESKDKNFSLSMRLNRIDNRDSKLKQKFEKQFQQYEISQQDSQIQQAENINSLQSLTKNKQKTLQSLAKPFIQTQSIVGDQQLQENLYSQCFLEVIRSDKKKEYVFQCNNTDTFQDVQKFIANLQKKQLKNIKLLLGNDDIWKSDISSKQKQSISIINQSPVSVKSKRNLSQRSNKMLSVKSGRPFKINSKVVQMAIKKKDKIICIQYQLLIDI